MTRYKDVHICNLEKRASDKLFPLPPNATFLQKAWTNFRELQVLNKRCVRSDAFFRNKSLMMTELKRHAKSYSFVIHPFSTMAGILDGMFTIIWIGKSIIIPLKYTFADEIPETVEIFYNVLCYIQMVVFLTFFNRGYVNYKRKEIIIESKNLIFHYLTTYFIFDFIATIGSRVFDLVYRFDTSRDLQNHHLWYFLAILFYLICHLVRIGTILNNIRDFFAIFKLRQTVYITCSHILIMVFLLNTMTTLIYRIPTIVYEHDYPQNSWIRKANLHNKSLMFVYDIYYECLIVVICAFFGASYEKTYTIQIPVEQYLHCVVSIIGRLYTLYFLSDLLKLFGLVGIAESKYEQYLDQLEEYINSKHLPPKLGVRLLTYYEYTLQKQYFNETQIINTLSEHLKSELFIYGARKLIEHARILQKMSKTVLGTLFSHMSTETFLVNDVITRIGSEVDNVYFISSGTVAVINEDNKEICHLEDGEEFGLISLAPGRSKQKYKHVAVETTEVYYISRKVLLEFLQVHQDLYKYFDSKLKSRAESFTAIENIYRKGGEDFMSHLREGAILERPNYRARRIDV